MKITCLIGVGEGKERQSVPFTFESKNMDYFYILGGDLMIGVGGKEFLILDHYDNKKFITETFKNSQ